MSYAGGLGGIPISPLKSPCTPITPLKRPGSARNPPGYRPDPHMGPV